MSAARRIAVNGVTLAVTDHGSAASADARTLVLAHATGFCGAVWLPLVPALRARFRVLTLDQRGHGDSDKPAGDYSWRDFSTDLAGVIDAFGVRDVYAGRIARAVLLDPVLVARRSDGEEPRGNPLAEGARRRRMVWDSRAQIIESFASRPPFDVWRRDFLEAYVEGGTFLREDGGVELKCPGAIEARVYEGAARSSSLDYLPRVRIPTLLVSGGVSPTLPPDLAHEAVRLLRDGRLEILPGVGHFVPMEAPDAVLRLLGAFLD
jgi:pimeloyl-ACP methyl ester carboxylesterase